MSTVSSTSSSTSSSTTSTTTKAATGASVLSSSDSGSGIDYSVLIEAKVAQKMSAATKLETKISDNEEKITAYEDLMTELQTVDSTISGLRNRTTSTSGSSSSSNLFSEREAFLSGGGSTGASNILDASIEDGTTKGTYSIVVEQLATKNKIGSSTQTSSSTALGLSGSFSIGISGGTTASISVESTDTLTSIATKINAQSSTTNVTASVLQVSDSSYELVLTTADTGETITVSNATDSTAATDLGLIDSSGDIANTLVAAQDAKFTVDGVEMTRSSNTISDAIDGVTFNLYEASTSAVTLEIASNLTDIKSAITAFVSAYNELEDFITSETARGSDGTAEDGATLINDAYLRAIKNKLSDILDSSVTNSDGDLLSLSTLGITLNSDGTLSLDEDTLNTALTDDLDDVQALLGLNMTSSSDSLSLLRYTSESASMAATLNFEMNEDGTIESVSVNGDSSLFTVSGNTITGASGSAYEGLVMVYSGSSGSVTFSVSSGIADQFYTQMDAYANSSTGTLNDAIDDLNTQNDTYESKVTDITDRAERYRTYLTNYYAKLEAKAEAAKTALRQVKASMGLDTSSS
jgi:flagellar hook-associated protein 2